jgi:hypothetical protein
MSHREASAHASHEKLDGMPNGADLELNDDERDLLRTGLAEWGGSAHLTDSMARAMGFEDRADFSVQNRRIVASLAAGEALSRADWRRALLATEVVFASDVVGSGLDWETTTGICDADTLRLLRSLQRKMTR